MKPDIYDVSPEQVSPLLPASAWLEYAGKFEEYGCVETALTCYSRAVMYSRIESKKPTTDDFDFYNIHIYPIGNSREIYDEAMEGCSRLGPVVAEKYLHHVSSPSEWGANRQPSRE